MSSFLSNDIALAESMWMHSSKYHVLGSIVRPLWPDTLVTLAITSHRLFYLHYFLCWHDHHIVKYLKYVTLLFIPFSNKTFSHENLKWESTFLPRQVEMFAWLCKLTPKLWKCRALVEDIDTIRTIWWHQMMRRVFVNVSFYVVRVSYILPIFKWFTLMFSNSNSSKSKTTSLS